MPNKRKAFCSSTLLDRGCRSAPDDAVFMFGLTTDQTRGKSNQFILEFFFSESSAKVSMILKQGGKSFFLVLLDATRWESVEEQKSKQPELKPFFYTQN